MKKVHRKILIWIGVGVLTGALLSIVYGVVAHKIPKRVTNSSAAVKGNAVVLTASGFSPRNLQVQIGQEVTFSTTSGNKFWPASDLHPTHTIYPEFDPKRPVGESEKWSFVFNKPGVWKYHDHLNPLFIGSIIVGDQGSSGTISTECANLSNRLSCWEQELDSVLQNKGIDSAFGRLAQLYATEPAFAIECHGFAHKLGQAAYEQYAQNKATQLSKQSSYCGYGFYHGFMETLLHTSGDIQEARDFCAYVGKALATETTDAEGACYHGIGHGAVDGSDPTAWGDVQKMMKPGMDLCEQVASSDRSEYGKMYRCVTGVYNALEILSGDSKYKLADLAARPFNFCLSQPEEYYEGCYTNMLPAQMRLRNSDFSLLAQDVQRISVGTAEKVKGPVLSSLFHEYIRMHLSEKDYGVANAVSLCRKQGALRLDCIEGLSGGHMKYGKPQEEYVQGLAFCGSALLQKDEAERCYGYILPRLRIWYTESKKQEVCNSVPAEYKHYCSP